MAMTGDFPYNAKAADAGLSPCPHCGYCPTCGRPGIQVYPSWPVPSWPAPYPWGPIWTWSQQQTTQPTTTASWTLQPT